MSVSLKEVLINNNFKFNKAFGQNFISDTNLLDAIVLDAGITKEDVVVEIGAGAGTLTEAIARKAKKVISFEIDKNLQPILDERLAEYDNIEVRFCDIMKVKEQELKDLGEFKVVANLPYYITTPIVMFFLEQVKNASVITVMVQKEVAERFSGNETGEDYGAITAVIDYYGQAKMTRVVGKNLFYPVPKVDSAVLKIERREKYFPESEKLFLKTVKTAFKMRRKTLSNNLLSEFSLSRDEVDEVIRSIGFEPSVRGEKLSTEDFVKLSNMLNKKLPNKIVQ